MWTVSGYWQVNIDNVLHTITVKFDIFNVLHVYFNDTLIYKSFVRIHWNKGEVYRFEKNSHKFILYSKGNLRFTMSFILTIDEQELSQINNHNPIEISKSASINIILEQNVVESVEIIDIVDIPLDNMAGSGILTMEHEISKTVTNELTLQTNIEINGKAGFSLFKAIETEISAKFARQSGQKIGETFTERRKLTFSVQPLSAAIYSVVWKRKVRSGEYVVSIEGGTKLVPYRVYYDLSYEVKSRKQ